MKVRFRKDQILQLLSANLGILEKKNTQPILNYLYFQADKNGKVITKATNYDISLLCEYEYDVIEEGTILLPCKSLYEIAKELPQDEDITIWTQENDRINIVCGTIFFKIIGIESTQFPLFPEFEGEHFKISTIKLRTMIDKVLFASSIDNTRYNLNGIFFEIIRKNDSYFLRMVATDGHRLSLVDIVCDDDNNIDVGRGIILQRKGVIELRKLLDINIDNINIIIQNNQMMANIGNSIIYIRLVDGEFPDYEMVIPKLNDKMFRVRKSLFLNAIKRVSILPNISFGNKSKSIQFKVTNGKLLIFTSQQETGEAKEEINIDYSGNEIIVGFNGKYIIDILNACYGEWIIVKLSDQLTAGIIHDGDMIDHLNVIMPIRI